MHYGVFFLGCVTLLACSMEGATQHLPAWLLRGCVAVTVVWLWPKQPSCLLYRSDLLAPLFCIMTVAVAWACAPNGGIAVQPFISTVLVAALFVALCGSSQDCTPQILAFGVLIATVNSVWAMGQRWDGALRGSGGFFNPNDLAAFTAPLWVFTLEQAQAPGARRRWWVLSATALALGLWATRSRGGVLGAALGATFLWLPLMRRRPALAILPALLGLAVLQLMQQRFWHQGDLYASSRITIWQQSMAVLWRHPFGMGLGHYGEAMRFAGVPIDDWVRYPLQATSGHSELVEALVEMGWLGGAAVAVPAMWALWRSRHSPSPYTNCGMWVALALPALTSTSLHVPPVAFLAAVWAAHTVRQGPLTAAATWAVPKKCCYAAPAAWLAALPPLLGVSCMQWAAHARDAAQLPQALLWAQRAAQIMPWSTGAAMLLASLHFEESRNPLATADELLDIAERHPDAPEPLVRAAQVLTAHTGNERNRWIVVIRMWEGAMQRDPHNALHWTELGRARLHASDEEGARTAFAEAVVQEPHCARALAHLAALTKDTAAASILKQRAFDAPTHVGPYHGYAQQILTLDVEATHVLEQL